MEPSSAGRASKGPPGGLSASLQDHLTESPALTETLVAAYYNSAANLVLHDY